MFASAGDVLETSDLTDLYQNPQYAYYLAGMDMSINRAILRIEAANALPMGRLVLDSPVVTGTVATYDLGRIADFDSVYEVRAMDGERYAAHTYRWEGGTTLVVPSYSSDVEYVLLYRRKVQLLEPMCSDDTTLDIPDALAALVPYFVKSELYEEEDAAAAKRARDYFEKGLDAVVIEGENDMPRLECKYKWEEL